MTPINTMGDDKSHRPKFIQGLRIQEFDTFDMVTCGNYSTIDYVGNNFCA